MSQALSLSQKHCHENTVFISSPEVKKLSTQMCDPENTIQVQVKEQKYTFSFAGYVYFPPVI